MAPSRTECWLRVAAHATQALFEDCLTAVLRELEHSLAMRRAWEFWAAADIALLFLALSCTVHAWVAAHGWLACRLPQGRTHTRTQHTQHQRKAE